MPSPSKQNERVLSYKLGGARESIQTWRNLHSIQMFGENVWKPAIGEILHTQQELDNAVDKFAVKVVKKNETVDHLLCEYSRILTYLIVRRNMGFLVHVAGVYFSPPS